MTLSQTPTGASLLDAAAAAGRSRRFGRWSRGAVFAAAPLPFEHLALPLVDAASQRLFQRLGPAAGLVAPAALRALHRDLAERLVHRLARAALAAFRSSTPAPHGTRNPTSTAAYDRFVLTCLDAGLEPLFGPFPLLAPLLVGTCEQWVDATVELVARFAADRAALAGLLCVAGGDVGRIVGIVAHLSDLHDGGRTVSRLDLGCGRSVAYKPRSLEPEALYAAVVAALGRPPIALRAPEVLVRTGYGWQVWVDTADADADADAADPSGDITAAAAHGALLALLTALGIGDAHRENVVQTPAGPVLVDAEVLAQPGAPVDVRSALLLPPPHVDGPPLTLPVWEHVHTDAVTIGERPNIDLTPLTLPHDLAAPAVAELIDGFVGTTGELRHGAAAVARALDRAGSVPGRQVLRPTVRYEAAREAGLLPEALVSTEVRRSMIRAELGGRRRHLDLGTELDALSVGDIPRSVRQTKVRLRVLEDAEVARQVRHIRAAFTATTARAAPAG